MESTVFTNTVANLKMTTANYIFRFICDKVYLLFRKEYCIQWMLKITPYFNRGNFLFKTTKSGKIKLQKYPVQPIDTYHDDCCRPLVFDFDLCVIILYHTHPPSSMTGNMTFTKHQPFEIAAFHPFIVSELGV